MARDADNILWLDLEMTGLDPQKERIIEIATIVTTKSLTVIELGPDLIIHQPDELLQAMDDWNTRHHQASGLTDAVHHSTLSTAEAEEQTLDFVSQHCAKGMAPLAGNSIHMDRIFLMLYMPRLNDWLHYRNIDVSTLKELGRRWFPETYEKRPKKKGNHRALEDVLESIEELRFYREAFFREL